MLNAENDPMTTHRGPRRGDRELRPPGRHLLAGLAVDVTGRILAYRTNLAGLRAREELADVFSYPLRLTEVDNLGGRAGPSTSRSSETCAKLWRS